MTGVQTCALPICKSQTETFFQFPVGDETIKKAQFEAATAQYVEAKGVKPERPIQPHMCITVHQSSCFNLEALEWAQDKMYTSQLWTQTYKQLIKPSITEIKSGGDFWVELEPVLELDKDGNQEVLNSM